MSACFEQKGVTIRDMNKTDFAIELARRTNMPRAKALEVTSVMLSIMSEALHRQHVKEPCGRGWRAGSGCPELHTVG